MTPVQRTLLIILAFVVVSVGSFIWYIATWDPAENDPISSIMWQFSPTPGAERLFEGSHISERPA